MAECTDFPILDITYISEPSRRRAIAEEITSATAQWGFLLLKGHPIPSSEVEEMFNLSHTFFSLDEAAKEPWPLDHTLNIGYVGSLRDRKKDDKMSMWFGGPTGALIDEQNAKHLPPYWHAHMAKVEAFKLRCHAFVLQLLECFALALDLTDTAHFAKAHNPAVAKGNSLRMLMYPARDVKPSGSTRMQPHTDSGSVTLLFQRSAGLEVLSPEGQWVGAPCLEDTVLVNIGDTMAFWSGGRLKATKHRVTFEGVPAGRERLSMAYFGAAVPETVLEPIGTDRGELSEFAYGDNGVDFRKGMTVGEYGDLIMKNIYGTEAVSAK
jgi:isopenicillin N synthase-like dioxygenase